MPDDKLKYITTKIISMEQGYYTLPLLDGSKVEDVNSTSIPFNVMLTISESSVARDKIPEEVTIVEHSFVLRQNGQRIEDNLKFLKTINYYDDVVHIFEVTN